MKSVRAALNGARRMYTTYIGSSKVDYTEADERILNGLVKNANKAIKIGFGTGKTVSGVNEITRAVNEGTKIHGGVIEAAIKDINQDLKGMRHPDFCSLGFKAYDGECYSSSHISGILHGTKIGLMTLLGEEGLIYDPTRDERIKQLKNANVTPSPEVSTNTVEPSFSSKGKGAFWRE